MGRSAKFHKRQNKKTTSSAGSSQSALSSQPAPNLKPKAAVTATPTPKEQKKHAGLRAKASKHKTKEGDGPILGGADYVELMFGGRRKAAVEAAKLPKDPDS